jgi:hypothetical protein
MPTRATNSTKAATPVVAQPAKYAVVSLIGCSSRYLFSRDLLGDDFLRDVLTSSAYIVADS